MAIIPNNINQEAKIETPQQQKTKKMVYLLVLICAVAAAILYMGMNPVSPADIGSSSETSQPSQDVRLFNNLRKINLENTAFEDKRVESLTQNGEFPISIGQKGRENPFAPFQ